MPDGHSHHHAPPDAAPRTPAGDDVTAARPPEAVLREFEQEMRTLLGAMTDLVFVIDRAGRHLKVGPTAPELLYRPAQFVHGRTLHEVFEPALADEALAAVRRALDTQQATTIDYELLISGARRWFSATVSPMDDTRALWVARDVTASREAEEAVRASEARYRLLFDANPLAMMLVDDATLQILEVNEAATSQYGWTREEFSRLSLVDIRPPADAEAALRSEFSASAEAYRIQGVRWHRRRDGSVFPVEVTGHRVVVGGRPARLAMVADVTERVRAERERTEAYHAMATLVEHSPLAIVALDADRRVSMWNEAAERMFGYARDEAIGRPLDILPDDRAHERVFVEHALEGTGAPAVNVETQRRRRDGSVVDVLLSTASLTGADGRRSAVAFFADMTDRRQLEAQLRQAQKLEAVGRLAGGIAHDFNNLLTAILNYDELLLGQFPEGDPVHDDLREIHDVALRAAALTRQLLAFSRQQALQPRSLDLATVVGTTESMLRRVIGEDVHLDVELPAERWLVRADPGQIEQVVMNLAVNARDAMPHGGTLAFRVEHVRLTDADAGTRPDAQAGEFVVLVVRDTGVGMDEATLARAFEPFFTTKEAGKGTGLGLATVYGIVHQSGGFVEIESAPGRGATFRVFLPRWTGPQDPEIEALAAPQRLHGSETILVVEDEQMVRAIATRVLRSHGYRVVEARTGREALGILERGEPAIDLVLTDFVMPEMGGPELARRAAALPSAPAFVFMSGYTGDALRSRGELPAGTVFLEKPFSIEQLLAVVQRRLDARDARPA